MITNDQELELVREQLERVEAALYSIKRDVLPRSAPKFRLMAEGYFDQINELRRQIDDYLGVTALGEAQADLVIELSGVSVLLGEARVSLVTRTLDTFRRGLQELMVIEGGDTGTATGGRRKSWIEKLCDPPLIGVAPGSVRICLGEPRTDARLFNEDERQMYHTTLRRLVEGLAWASGLETDVPQYNEKSWHAVLSVVRKLVPPRDGDVEQISFEGRVLGLGRRYGLTKATRQRVDTEIRRVTTTQEYNEVEGIIREVDLDKRIFILRERPDGRPELPCEYDELSEGDVKVNLDARVLVSGLLRTTGKAKRQVMDVENIEPLGADLPPERSKS